MDAEAKKFDLIPKDVLHDGDCFFSAALVLLNKIDPPLLKEKTTPDDLRTQTVDYMRKNPSDYTAFFEDGAYETYLDDMDEEGTWADYPAWFGFAKCFNVTLVIIPDNGSPPTVVHCDSPRALVTLGHMDGAHFQALHRSSKEIALPLQKIINEARPETDKEECPSTNKIRRTSLVDSIGAGSSVSPSELPRAGQLTFFPSANGSASLLSADIQPTMQAAESLVTSNGP